MEFLFFGAWLPVFLAIMAGFLGLLIIGAVISRWYTDKKIKSHKKQTGSPRSTSLTSTSHQTS